MSGNKEDQNHGLIDGEVWAVLPHGNYAASTHGRVMRTSIGRSNSVPGKISKTWINKKGYVLVRLCNDGIPSTTRVHVLVALAFIGERPTGYEINHKDGCKTNNSLSNLEYVTSSENKIHAIASGLKVPKTKISRDQVSEIRQAYSQGQSQSSLALKFGCTQANISMIVLNKTRVVH